MSNACHCSHSQTITWCRRLHRLDVAETILFAFSLSTLLIMFGIAIGTRNVTLMAFSGAFLIPAYVTFFNWTRVILSQLFDETKNGAAVGKDKTEAIPHPLLLISVVQPRANAVEADKY